MKKSSVIFLFFIVYAGVGNILTWNLLRVVFRWICRSRSRGRTGFRRVFFIFCPFGRLFVSFTLFNSYRLFCSIVLVFIRNHPYYCFHFKPNNNINISPKKYNITNPYALTPKNIVPSSNPLRKHKKRIQIRRQIHRRHNPWISEWVHYKFPIHLPDI